MAANIVNAMPIKLSNRPNNYLCSLGTKSASIVSCTSVSFSTKAVIDVMPNLSVKRNVEACDQILIERRSGNYSPPTWDFDYIQSLNNQYKEERDLKRVDKLVGQVKKLLEEEFIEPIQKLELIDDLQRMGISYHFHDKINQILNSIYDDHQHKFNRKGYNIERDLYSTALEFRLLRQHGFNISQEVFDCFKNNDGDFKASLVEDTRGLLQLYEASFMLMEGEETLERSKEFATYFLHKTLEEHELIDENLSLLVHHALEMPIHWRVQRPNARWFIDVYERRPDMNLTVLELAKLDFNIVQATHQEELKHLSRWWKQTRLAEYLPFARDRLVENYLWTIGIVNNPQCGYSRIKACKVNVFATVIDDIFDIYGTLEELQLFNNAIQRWDTESMERLPQYMKMCYLALNNFIDEMAYDVLKEQGFLIIPYLRKSWADLCTSYLKEAEWYYTGYKPTLEEYINNAWISISAPAILSHTYFLVTNPIENKVVQSLYKYHDIVRYSAMILRLADDLGTSTDEMKRGDIPKSIECYMNESGASREEAREYVRFLICETWKKMNQERVANSPFPQIFVTSAADLGRTAQYMYQYGDAHGIQNPQIKERISTLLFEPML